MCVVCHNSFVKHFKLPLKNTGAHCLVSIILLIVIALCHMIIIAFS